MAVLTNISRLHVRGVLAGCIRAVVAARAITSDVNVIEIGWNPACSGMTVVAVVAADNMIRVFTACNCPVVTGATTTNDLTVIDRKGRRETVCRMTVLANSGRQYVSRVLARGVSAVVAGGTIPDDIGMIKNSRRPGGGAVAIVTLLARYDMRGRFANSLKAIVTGVAAAVNRSVIYKGDGGPGGGGVAVGTSCG